jgi:hypothetical protein
MSDNVVRQHHVVGHCFPQSTETRRMMLAEHALVAICATEKTRSSVEWEFGYRGFVDCN